MRGQALCGALHDVRCVLVPVGAPHVIRQGALNPEGALDYGNVCFTTTDIDGALSVTGLTLQKVRWRAAHPASRWPWLAAPHLSVLASSSCLP